MEPGAYLGSTALLNSGESISTVSTVAVPLERSHTQQKAKRSRNGCLSCKRLKIKCDEAKPRCEYCVHRNKDCAYPPPSGLKTARKIGPKKKSIHSLQNPSTKDHKINKRKTKVVDASSLPIQNNFILNLNSMRCQLSIDMFELRLMRHFLDFGGEFFSFNKNDRVNRFWSYDISRQWGGSELMKNALLTLSSLKLLHQFELNSITNVYLQEDLSLHVFQDQVMAQGTSIYKLTHQYFEKTLQLLQQAIIDPLSMRDVVTAGQIIAVNIIIFAYVTVHPVSPVSFVSFQELGTSSGPVSLDLLDICVNFHRAVGARYHIIQGSVFECMSYAEENSIMVPDMTDGSIFHFVQHLRDYVSVKVDPLNLEILGIYNRAISAIELGCYRAFTFGYIMPVFRIVLDIARGPGFIRLVRLKDYIALKILFHYSALCSISGFKLYSKESIWDSYILDFKNWVEQKLGNVLEDYDAKLYDLAMRSNYGEYQFQMEMLRYIGDPAFEMMYGGIGGVGVDVLGIGTLGLPPRAR